VTTAPVRVDAHHHLWTDPTPSDYPWLTDDLAAIRRPFTTADLTPLLASEGIGASVVVQTRSSVAETEGLLATAASSPVIAGVVGWLDLTDPGIGDAIAGLRDRPGGDRLVGIRHQVHDEPDPDWLRRPDVRRGIAMVGSAGLAYDLLVRTRELPAAVDTIRAIRDVRFVVDHLAKPPIRDGSIESWVEGTRPLGELPNVVAKVSGLVTEADWAGWTVDDLVAPVRHGLELFGPSRLLFGSDWPVCLVAASYDRVARATSDALAIAGLPVAEQGDIFGPNAVALYGLRLG